jgi:hypothetical protein
MVSGAAALTVAATGERTASRSRTPEPVPEAIVSVNPDRMERSEFDPADFGIVGVYDVDWLAHPDFTLLLDNMAASPRAFRAVRFFGAFTAGTPEDFLPESGGVVWNDPENEIDFTRTFDALEALTSRGLIPFISLSFFPPAISESPITPPSDWGRWKRLVRTFFEELKFDPRFGRDAIASWWFEVWNEPNEGRFWSGTQDEYFALYRATSEVVNDLALPIRLGGPAIAYRPQEDPDFGVPWMDRFFRFIASDPDLRLDFVSFHRKGTVESDPPDPRRLHEAAVTTADQMLAIDPARFSGIPIINNEADEKVGFEVPYVPRMHEAGAAWLGAVAAIHAGLDADYFDHGLTFIGAADNANLQLVKEPFDGRRSIMTLAGDSPTDLVKVPAYAFYELLPMLGDRLGAVVSGEDRFFPATDLYQIATASDDQIGCLLAYYPDPDSDGETRLMDYVIEGIPWPEVNIAQFWIDREHSNSYRTAGGSDDDPYPVPARDLLGEIRQSQELTVSHPIDRGVDVPDGIWRAQLELRPFTTVLLWITPTSDDTPAAPDWLSIEQQGQDAILHWTPNRETSFYSYEVFLTADGEPGDRLTPEPLRAALWIDTAPPSGPRTYGVRAVSASGIASPITTSPEVNIRS